MGLLVDLGEEPLCSSASGSHERSEMSAPILPPNEGCVESLRLSIRTYPGGFSGRKCWFQTFMWTRDHL
jgi:hypothetical protein